MIEKAKLSTIFLLILILIVLMVAYYFLAKGDETLTGGFIATATYLIKKLADQVDDIIDKLWGIQHKQEEKPDV